MVVSNIAERLVESEPDYSNANTYDLALLKKAQARFPNANKGGIEPNMTALGACETPEDQRLMIISMLGDMRKKRVLGGKLIVATFVTPQKSKGGIIYIDKRKDASRYEGKVGLVICIGPAAFMFDQDTTYKYIGPRPAPGDWVWYRASDAPERWIKEVSCRSIHYGAIEGITDNPADVF